jgi:hypothetical protein
VPNWDGNALAAVAAVALAICCGDAAAQVLYKWVDADGKTQYSDRPPKNFTGTVTRMEPDEQPPAAPRFVPQKPGGKAADAAQETVAAPPDASAKRRELRRKLEADVANARAKLDFAKAALEAASSPNDDERQVIQQKVEKGRPAPGAGSASTGGMMGSGGMHGGAPRSNCKTVKGSDGRTITTCPTAVPNDAYYDRVKQLEDAVKTAEEELSAAELAYRRGVD